MSLRKSLERLTSGEEVSVRTLSAGGVVAQPARPVPKSAASVPAATPKTAPGAMMRFIEAQAERDDRVKELEDRLQSFEGALPVRSLDANRVRSSRFSNRHEDHFRSQAYQQLVDDISVARGNVQPIRVRPVTGDPESDYEVVFGHRRLRACQQLNIPVAAIVAQDDDAALFEAMCRENLSRADLSAYEEGRSYLKALELKIYPSQRQLAAAVGITQAHVSQVVAVAKLPDEVVAVFPSPLDIQYRWADVLHELWKKDRAGMHARIRSVSSDRFSSARQVYEHLIEKPRDSSVDVVVDGKKRAVITARMGVLSVAFSKHAVPGERMEELQKLLAHFLAGSDQR